MASFNKYYEKMKLIYVMPSMTTINPSFMSTADRNELKTVYWDAMRADDIPSQCIAELCVDWLVCEGLDHIKDIQLCLDVATDGIVGPQTMRAIREAHPPTLFFHIKSMRAAHYAALCEQHPQLIKSYDSWLQRLSTFTFK